MSHNINYNLITGQHSFFSVQQKAWHGLGQIVSDYPTSAQAIKYAGLDFQVSKNNLFTYAGSLLINADGTLSEQTQIAVPNYYATVRTDTNQVLGVVGRDYQIVQNRDAFSFFDQLAGSDGIFYETAGALGNGERIFITAKLPGYIRVGQDDMIERYLFLTTSHDGSGAITAGFTPVRIVCENTLNAAMQSMTNTIRIRHTTNAVMRLKAAERIMGISNKRTEQLQTVFNHWAKVSITDSQLRRLVQAALIPNKEALEKVQAGKECELSSRFTNTIDSVMEYAQVHHSQQMETTMGTVFGAYNAITGYFQNACSYKDPSAKIKSILMGGHAQMRGQSAFDFCTAFAKYGEDALTLN